MPITRTALIDDDGTGTTGTVLNNAWYQAFCDAIDAGLAGVQPGGWVAAPPSSVTDDAGTVLGTASILSRYMRINPTTIIWEFRTDLVTVTASTVSIHIKGLPFTAAQKTAVNSVPWSSSALPVLYVKGHASNVGEFLLNRADQANIPGGSYYVGFTGAWETT